MYEVYAFESSISRAGKGRLIINIPSYLRPELEKHSGKSCYVVVYVYVPSARAPSSPSPPSSQALGAGLADSSLKRAVQEVEVPTEVPERDKRFH